ncbi:glycoside hydrolase domain-containing protein [Amycolatopsis sp. NPDC051373]|uniref:glycoside hydrolase domain-containing protein n=1 Tax=Amycolatopsis sp. NPDC051373 TaxID=3155801 RepID=UPI00344DB524
MATVLDYSTGRPSGAAVAGRGHAGVVRYIGTPGRPKNLTRAEFLDLDAHGVGVALVYENHGGDAAGGRSAGVVAAQTARADADACGFPRDRPIYFAVDSDQVTAAQFDAVMAYLDGVASVLGSVVLVGVYGEYDVIEQAVGPHARYGWQTAAWSHGKKSGKAALYQKLGTVEVDGVDCDESDVLADDWGQHNYQGATAPSTDPGVELMERITVTPPNNGQNSVRLNLPGGPNCRVIVRPPLTPGAKTVVAPMWVGHIYAWGQDGAGIGHDPAAAQGYNDRLDNHRTYPLPGALWCDLNYSAAKPFVIDVVG